MAFLITLVNRCILSFFRSDPVYLSTFKYLHISQLSKVPRPSSQEINFYERFLASHLWHHYERTQLGYFRAMPLFSHPKASFSQCDSSLVSWRLTPLMLVKAANPLASSLGESNDNTVMLYTHAHLCDLTRGLG
jgi:hypothetical protein